jgi:hypothetical protein
VVRLHYFTHFGVVRLHYFANSGMEGPQLCTRIGMIRGMDLAGGDMYF